MSRDRLDNRYESPGRWADRAACAGKPAGTFLVDVRAIRRAKTRPAPPYALDAVRHATDAKQICKTECPVLVECRAWAMTEPDPAYELVAGGLDPVERSDIRRRERRLREAGLS